MPEAMGFYTDTIVGTRRLVYVFLEGRTVTAYACFVPGHSIEGLPSLDVGYAVPLAYRERGLARQVFSAGILDLQARCTGGPSFFVTAIMARTNIASQRVAQHVLGGEPLALIDGLSDTPAFRYSKMFMPGMP